MSDEFILMMFDGKEHKPDKVLQNYKAMYNSMIAEATNNVDKFVEEISKSFPTPLQNSWSL